MIGKKEEGLVGQPSAGWVATSVRLPCFNASSITNIDVEPYDAKLIRPADVDEDAM